MKRLLTLFLSIIALFLSVFAFAEDSKILIQGDDDSMLQVKIDNTTVSVAWEENDAVTALRSLAKDGLTIKMSMYGGFEQVGAIGHSLPAHDVQTSTNPGDIVLYSGNQLVVFYGSNSWAYTRLGKITDQTPGQLKALLSQGDVTITLLAD